MPKIVRVLTGCTSPETAFVQSDYPYGRQLRCQRRCWLEYKKGKGFRFVTQTTDPKRAYLHWNAPKASTYQDFALLVLTDEHTDENGEPTHVDWIGGGVNGSYDQIEAICAAFWNEMDETQQYVAKVTRELTKLYGSPQTGRLYVVTDYETGENVAYTEAVTAGWHGFAGASRVRVPEVKITTDIHSIGERFPAGVFDCPRLGRRVKVEWVQGSGLVQEAA